MTLLDNLLYLIVLLFVRTASAAMVPGQTRQTSSFNNPVIWEDLADLDLLRINDTFLYSASTMHYSPGAPILRSYDLVNWEYIGHSVPRLDFGDAKYDLDGGNAYIRGLWASTLRFRPSNAKYYWIGCIDFSKTYIYTADDVQGEWTQASVIDNCYYDCGLLVDDDDKLYVVYGGGNNVSVAQLSEDGLSEVSNQVVYTSDIGREGNRFYKRDGNYYIITDVPATTEFVLKSTTGPFGPYERQTLVDNSISPIVGAGPPHKGALIDTADGQWFYMAFTDSYPGGRVPILAPISWDDDGWPTINLPNNEWGVSYPYPLPEHPLPSLPGIANFTSVGLEWEWNHNPDNSAWSLDDGLALNTATVTTDLYSAKNTITHRILGPKSNGTVLLDVSRMTDGDRAGISMLRDISAFIMVKQTGSTKELAMVNGVNLNATTGATTGWLTVSEGSEIATAPFSGDQIWLRVTADIAPAPGGSTSATFSYSTDGSVFTDLGNILDLNRNWEFFMGYRFGIFNFASVALGGSVTVKSFEQELAT
ncbi:Arabinanase/levansucrase/invertase [Dendrothele bispora CBS 962.96]|uniref:Arabinanase/levansucrase/invertase n=1 Tax=Dendrothele bispora (strain CBS 962.96) TaxID=1314807 RepID=A0A4V4HIR5_DENBC|nr:Arabinanase/levansucrase/invertase [Dendrothele bispora CBS 962.96]